MEQTLDRLSDYAASLAVSSLSPEAIHAVKRSVIDSFGCALGALNVEPVKIGKALASRVSSKTPASILGVSAKTSPEMAAFVNGIMIRYLDFNDDYINKDGPHPSDNIPAVLAVAEALHADGKNLACGITLAYEIVDLLVDSAEFMSRGWDYGTETSIGSAVGAGKVLGLSKQQMTHALALAIMPNITLRQTREGELSMWKSCAGPAAARNGVFAALLASEGMTGPDQPFEGRYGLWNQVTGRFELPPLGGQGRPFKIQSTFFKPRPVAYTALLPIEVALALRDKIDLNNIESVNVVLGDFDATGHKDLAKWHPHTRETADHSIPYLVASALVYGEISNKTFAPERFHDPQILAVLQKLTVEKDPVYIKEFPKTFHCHIEVIDKSGQKLRRHLQNPKGHPSNPMSDAEIEEKFLKLAEHVLTQKQARIALDLLWHLDELDDVGKIFEVFAALPPRFS